MKTWIVNASYTERGLHFQKTFEIPSKSKPNAEDFKKWFEKRFDPLKIKNVVINSAEEQQ